jgi:hypothetical protein
MDEIDKSIRSGAHVAIAAMFGYLFDRLERIDPEFDREAARTAIMERLKRHPEGDDAKQAAAETIISASLAQQPRP